MTSDAYGGPLPKPTPETKPYWEAAKQHRLVIQRCNDCTAHYFYPRPLCPRCLSRNVEWVQACGRGILHTYVINHRPPRGFPVPPPYVIGIIELEEGARMLAQVVDLEPDPAKIRCGTPVEVTFEDVTAEVTLPKFRPRKS